MTPTSDGADASIDSSSASFRDRARGPVAVAEKWALACPPCVSPRTSSTHLVAAPQVVHAARAPVRVNRKRSDSVISRHAGSISKSSGPQFVEPAGRIGVSAACAGRRPLPDDRARKVCAKRAENVGTLVTFHVTLQVRTGEASTRSSERARAERGIRSGDSIRRTSEAPLD
jgi:hypothetical protein